MPPKEKQVPASQLPAEQKPQNLKLKEMRLTTTVEDLLASGALPSGIDSKEKIMTICQYGKELGLDAMTSLNNIYLIKGKMVIASSILGALLRKNGYDFKWTANWEKDTSDKNTKGEVITKIYSEIEIFWMSKTLSREMSSVFRMTWNEIEQAGLAGKEMYEKYPKQMLRARTMSAAVRAICPEIMMGLYTTEELADRNEIDMQMTKEGDILPRTEDIEHTEVKD
jgi:hypothetical protein